MSRLNFGFGRKRIPTEADPFRGHDFSEAGLSITVHPDGTETHEAVYPVIADGKQDVRGSAALILNMGPGRPITVERPADNN